MGWNGTSEMNTFRLLSTSLPHLSWHKCLFIHLLFVTIQTTKAPFVNCLPETMNNQDKELEIIWPLGTMSQVNCIFQKKTMEEFCLHRNDWKHVCGRWTYRRIYCWWWWWSQSSSQLAGSTASFGNWESLTGKERQQLYIQMDAGRKGPDVFFIQVILRIFCTNWLDSDSECLFQSFTNISEQRGAF